MIDDLAPTPDAAEQQATTRQLWLLRVTAATFYFAYNMQKSVLIPLYIIQRTCQDMYDCTDGMGSLDDDDAARVSRIASGWTSWVLFAMNVLACVTTCFLTSNSDVIGRRPVLLFAVTCGLVSAGTSVVAVALRLPLWCLLLCSMVSGLGGSFATFNAAAFASVADMLPSKRRRSRAFSLLEARLLWSGMLCCATMLCYAMLCCAGLLLLRRRRLASHRRLAHPG